MTDEDQKGQVVSWIENNRDIIVDFLSDYIRHPSINPDLESTSDPTACQRWLASRLRDEGVFETVDYWTEKGVYANIVAVAKGTSGNRTLMFVGHSDTVPVTSEQQKAWNTAKGPFSGIVEDGRIWGRGATDMKAGNVAALMAVVALKKIGVSLADDIIFGFVSSEESGNRTVGIDSIVKRGYRAPNCIIMEPTNLEVVPAIQGEFYFQLKVFGKSCHIASRHQAIYPTAYGAEIPGVNAIEKTVKYLHSLWDLEQQWGLHRKHPLLDPGAMTLNVAQINGGETFSALAGSCEIVGSVLYSPSLSRDVVVDEFKSAINRVTEGDYWLREHPPELKLPYALPDKHPTNTSSQHVLGRVLADAFQSVRNAPASFTASVSTSDGNYLVDHDVDVVVFGPGRFDMGAHGINEYVPIEQVIDCTKVFACALLDWPSAHPSAPEA